uniref:Uncharacterized protein n=1 Tax=Steinernema glaseri TaxID=37863 RepID=A0A1I7Z6C6_9BILA
MQSEWAFSAVVFTRSSVEHPVMDGGELKYVRDLSLVDLFSSTEEANSEQFMQHMDFSLVTTRATRVYEANSFLTRKTFLIVATMKIPTLDNTLHKQSQSCVPP